MLAYELYHKRLNTITQIIVISGIIIIFDLHHPLVLVKDTTLVIVSIENNEKAILEYYQARAVQVYTPILSPGALSIKYMKD
jgi:hypothetical protein